MQGWRDEPFPVAFVLIALKAERMTPSFHSVAGVDGSRYDESAQTTLNALLLNPRPDVFFIELTHDVSGVEPFHGLLEAFQDHIGTHAPHLAADQFMVAHHHGALFEVLGLVVQAHQHPRRFFSRRSPAMDNSETSYFSQSKALIASRSAVPSLSVRSAVSM